MRDKNIQAIEIVEMLELFVEFSLNSLKLSKPVPYKEALQNQREFLDKILLPQLRKILAKIPEWLDAKNYIVYSLENTFVERVKYKTERGVSQMVENIEKLSLIGQVFFISFCFSLCQYLLPDNIKINGEKIFKEWKSAIEEKQDLFSVSRRLRQKCELLAENKNLIPPPVFFGKYENQEYLNPFVALSELYLKSFLAKYEYDPKSTSKIFLEIFNAGTLLGFLFWEDVLGQ